MRGVSGRTLIVVCALASLAAGCAQLETLPKLRAADLRFKPAQSSRIYAADGSLITTLHGIENRTVVPLEAMPGHLRRAVIAIEDERFYEHSGVDLRAIVRAAVANFTSGGIREGGSTITQQYVKQVIIAPGAIAAQTLDRKIDEAILARQLERRLTKKEILHRYLNTVYFGRGAYGVQAAARTYFSKSVGELTLPESALLAALIRSPETYNPFDKRRLALARRDLVLDKMVELGWLSELRRARAAAKKLGLNPARSRDRYLAPYFVDYVRRLIEFDPRFEFLGDTPRERERQLFSGGLRIHTTVDLDMQRAAEAAARSVLPYAADPYASLVSMEPRSGHVKAMVGGRDYFAPRRKERYAKFNLAITGEPRLAASKQGGRSAGTGRQAGSAFKPIVLAAALEEGFTPAYAAETTSGQTIEGCERSPGVPYQPRNFAGSGGGWMNMYQAITVSNNVYHVKLSRDAGVPKVLEMSQRLGLKNIPNASAYENERACSIGLGAADVYPVEFAAVFATFANRGSYCAPFAITKIEDRYGNTIYSHRDNCEQVLDRGIADRLTELLHGPVRPNGTAGYVSGQLGRPVAGKTGTTNDFKDAWFAGYVPQYATVAWVGYEIPRELFNITAGGQTYARVTGGSIPGRMWADYMAAMLADVPVERFAQPPPIPTRTVPDVVGMEEDEAIEVLEDRDFRVRTEVVEHYEPAGTVVEQNPEGGASVWVGSLVLLRISDGRGDPPKVEVPNVIGMTKEEAEAALEDAGFRVQVRPRETIDPDQEGKVVEQDPSGGTEVDPESRVRIYIGEFVPPPTPTPTPPRGPPETPGPPDDGDDDSGNNENNENND
jgi:penicillin-binding protein 1A